MHIFVLVLKKMQFFNRYNLYHKLLFGDSLFSSCNSFFFLARARAPQELAGVSKRRQLDDHGYQMILLKICNPDTAQF